MYDFCFQLKHLSCVILFHNLRHPYIHFDFEEMIFPLVTSQSIRPKEVLVSFDVVSLFTNIPVDLAVSVAQRKLSTDDTLLSRTNSCIDELVLLRNTTYLLFRGRFIGQLLILLWVMGMFFSCQLSYGRC